MLTTALPTVITATSAPEALSVPTAGPDGLAETPAVRAARLTDDRLRAQQLELEALRRSLAALSAQVARLETRQAALEDDLHAQFRRVHARLDALEAEARALRADVTIAIRNHAYTEDQIRSAWEVYDRNLTRIRTLERGQSDLQGDLRLARSDLALLARLVEDADATLGARVRAISRQVDDSKPPWLATAVVTAVVQPFTSAFATRAAEKAWK